MSKLTRNQIIAILVFGAVILGSALVILSNRQSTEPTDVVTTESVDATVVAQNATEEPSSQPSPTPQAQTRSDDSDGDGVPNDGTDQCPEVAGDAAFNGCPNPDTDGDGVDDSKEPAECVGAPDAGFGIGSTGCPNPDPNTVNDDDGDGFVNASDSCPTQGDAGFGIDGTGCPNPDPNTVNDDDGDGFVNASDSCPTQGDAGFGIDGTGCPLPNPDSDGDGVADTNEPAECIGASDLGAGFDASGCPIVVTPDVQQNQQGDEWDKSSVAVRGECANGVPTFYVENTGDAGEGDMDAPTTWRLTDVNTNNIIASGTIQVAGKQTETLTFPEFAGLTVRLNVDQRPGHPGSSQPNAVVENCGTPPVVTEVIPTDEPTEVVTEVPPTEEPTPVVTPTENVTPQVTPPVVPSSGDFISSIQCNHNNGTVTFTVTNNGSAMAQGVSYPVTYSTTGRNASSNVSVGEISRLGAGASKTFTVRSQSGNTITFSVGTLGLSQTVECWDKSSVSVGGQCLNGVPTFSVTNTGTEGMTNFTTWRVTDISTGNVILTGTIQLAGSETKTLTFPQFAGMRIRLNVDQRPGHPGSSNPNAAVENCGSVPVVTPNVTPEVTPTEDVTPIVTPTEDVTPDVTPTDEPTPDVTPTEEPTPVVTPTEEPQPFTLSATLVCANNGTVTYTMTLTSGSSVPLNPNYPVYMTVDGSSTMLGTVNGLTSTRTFSQPGKSGKIVTFSVDGLPDLTKTVECWDKSSVSVSGECKDGVPTFYVSNTGIRGMAGETTWRLEDSNGSVLTNGTIILAGSETKTLTFPEYANLSVRLWVDQRPGHPGSSNPTDSAGPCVVSTPEPTPDVTPTDEPTPEPTPDETPPPPPAVYTPSGICGENGVFVFTISHSGTPGAGVSFTVSDGVNTLDSGTLNHEEAASFSRSYTSIARVLTFTINYDGQTYAVTAENCYVSPTIELSGVCANNGEFIFNAVINGSPLGSFTYSIVDENGVEVAGGNLNDLLDGEAFTGAYQSLTLSVSADTDTTSVNPYRLENCYKEPAYYVNVYCTGNNGEVAVSIEYDGTQPFPGTVVEYDIVDSEGTVLVQRTPFSGAAYPTFISRFAVTATVYVNGEAVASDTGEPCYVPPVYEVSAYCTGINGEYSFSVVVSGGAPLLPDVPTFVITDENGAEVRSGSITELPVTLSGIYQSLTITVTTIEGEVLYNTQTASCYTAPQFYPSAVCGENNASYVFSVEAFGNPNVNGIQLPNYTITDNNGTVLYTGAVSFPFAPIFVISENAPLTMSFSDGNVSIETVQSPDCFQPPAYVPNVYCEYNGQFVVSIVNNGGQLVDSKPTYEIIVDGQSQGVVEFSQTPVTVNVNGRFGNVTVIVTYNGSSTQASSSECYRAPEYTPSGFCGANGQYIFFLAQVGGGISYSGAEPTFIITGDGFNTITGTMSQLSGYMPISFAGAPLTMTVQTTEGIILSDAPISLTCYEPPVYTPSAYCGEENGSFFFEVSLVGTPITGVEPTFTIIGEGTQTYFQTGPISQLPNSIVGQYSRVTFTVQTTEGTVSQQVEPLTTCYNPPVYVPSVECTGNNGEFVVTVVNNGGEPVGGTPTIGVIFGGKPYAVNIENAVLPYTETFTGDHDFVEVVVYSLGVEPVYANNATCYNPPVYVPYAECGEENGQFIYGFTNVGGTPLFAEPVAFSVTDENGEIIADGSAVAPYESAVNDTYQSVTIWINETEASATAENCYQPPVYTASLVCDNNGSFNGTISNIGAPSDDSLSYEITNENGEVVASGNVDTLPFTIPTFTSTSQTLTLRVIMGGEITVYETSTAGCYVEAPQFDASLICENNGTAIYTVTLVSGDMGSASYDVYGGANGQLNIVGVLMGLNQSNTSQTFELRRMSGNVVTFSVAGFESLTREIECWDKSSVSVDGECKDGVITFYVTNTGTEGMSGETTWRLEDANGNVLTSGTLILAGSEIKEMTFPEFAGQDLRLWVDQRPGHPGSSQPNASVATCAEKSVYTPAGVCAENGQFTFTISHSGGIGNGVSFTVTDGATTIDSGTLSHDEAVNFSRTYNSTSSSLTFTVTNTDNGQIKAHTQENCYVAPRVNLNGYCEGNGIFAFSASIDGSPVGTFSYIVSDEGGNTVAQGDLSELFNGVTYTGSYQSLTLSVTANGDPITVTPKTVSNCYNPPQYNVDVYCASGGNGIYWVYISDNGVTPLPNTTVEYEVLDGSGNPLISRTAYIGVVYQSFENQTAVTANLYVNGELVSTDSSDDCYRPPVYVASAECVYGQNGGYSFTASNIGGTPITVPATFVIVDENGNTVRSGSVSELPIQFTSTAMTLTMTVTTSEGSVQTQAESISCYNPPVIVANGYCADQNGGYSFSISNIGGSIINGSIIPQTYVVKDANGTEIASGSVVIPFTPISLTSENGPLSLYFGDESVPAATTPDCFTAPQFEANVYCGESNGAFIVSVVNKGGVVVDTRPTYEIFVDGESQGVVEFGGETIQIPINGMYNTVSVTVTYGNATAEAVNNTCYQLPEYTPSGYCGDNGQFYFSIAQTGGGAPFTNEFPTFTISGDGFNTVTGNMFQLPAMPIVGQYDNGLTMTVQTTEGLVTVEAPVTLDCYEPPVYTPSLVCGEENGTYLFSVIQSGGTPIGTEEPTFSINMTDVNGVMNISGPLSQLPSSLTGRYNSVSLTISTNEGSVSAQAEPATCYNPPVYVPAVECTESNGTFVVTVVNTGGAPVGGEVTILVDFAVINGGGTAAALYENASLPFSETFVGNYQYVGVSVSSPDVEPVYANNDACYNPPVYVPSVECGEGNGNFVYSISNVGGTPIYNEAVEYTIMDEDDNIIEDGSQVPPFSGVVSGRYESVTVWVDRTETSATVEGCYQAPEFLSELFCVDPATSTFGGTIFNIGGSTDESVFYEVYDGVSGVIASGMVSELPFTIPNVVSASGEAYLVVYLVESIVSEAEATECLLPPPPPPTPEPTPTVEPTPEPTPTVEPTPTETPEEPVCGETIETPDGQITINLEMCNPDPEIGVQNWSPIQIGGAICPDWLVYHTNKTGDWELFRLGELPDGLTGPENLSQGVGPDVYDLAPSRSPDGLWIAFASTRDTAEGSRVKNWEIYVARVTGDDTRRITYNEFAMDLDPVWAPNGLKLAYETTTDNGDWEVRVFDLLTGENTIVTNNPANDINPSWSPDGSKLLIQSDREGGLWQIYEIDLANGNAVTRLSDGSGDDHDPMYSNDGTKVVFRSYRDDPRPDGDRSRVSAVYYMNSDGTGVTRISEVGGNATNHVFSPDDKLIAYQSNIVNGINDIYVFEIATGRTRLLTNNTGDYANIQDTAPTWYCESTLLVFTSSVDATDENPDNTNVFMVDALPIDAPPINADVDATRLTDDEEIDRDAQNSPSEENASRYGQVPPKWRP